MTQHWVDDVQVALGVAAQRGERRRQHRHPVGDAGDEVAALQGT